MNNYWTQLLTASCLGIGVGAFCAWPIQHAQGTPSCECDEDDLDDVKMDFAVHDDLPAGVPTKQDMDGWCEAASQILQTDDGPADDDPGPAVVNVDDNETCIKFIRQSTTRGFTYTVQGNPGPKDVTSQTQLRRIVVTGGLADPDYEAVVVDSIRLGGVTVLGAALRDWAPIILVDTPTDETMPHEVGHWAGLPHRETTNQWVMHDTASEDMTRVNEDERDHFLDLAADN